MLFSDRGEFIISERNNSDLFSVDQIAVEHAWRPAN